MAAKRAPSVSLLPSPDPYACGEGRSPFGGAVFVEDGEGNGAVIPRTMFEPITVIPKEAPPAMVPWRGAESFHASGMMLLAAALDPQCYDPARFEGFFSHPTWRQLVAVGQAHE